MYVMSALFVAYGQVPNDRAVIFNAANFVHLSDCSEHSLGPVV